MPTTPSRPGARAVDTSGPLPLSGDRILVTAHRRADELGGALERRGATVVHAPSLSIVPHADDAELLRRTRELLDDPPDIVVATTGVGFRGWLEAAEAAGTSEPLIGLLREARIIARGPKARGAIQSPGLAVDWVAESETSAEVKQYLATLDLRGRHVAVQHHGAGADGIDELIEESGGRVTSLVVYRWGPPPDPNAVAAGIHAVATGDVDAIVFTSAPGVVAFLDAAESDGRLQDVLSALADPAGPIIATVGPVTAAPLLRFGLRPLVPERYRLGALVRLLSDEVVARKSRAV